LELQGAETVAQPPQPGVVVAGKRFLEPHDTEAFELAGNVDSGLKAPLAVAAHAGQHARLVGIDQDREAVAELAADRLDHLDVLAGVVGMEAKLDRSKPIGCDAPAVFDPALGRPDLPSRAVGPHTLRV